MSSPRESSSSMDADFRVEIEDERKLGYDDVFPIDEDGVVDNNKLRGYNTKEYLFLNEDPPTLSCFLAWI